MEKKLKKCSVKKVVCLFVLFFVFFPALADENKGESFNFWGSGEIFALNPVKDGVLLGSGILLSGGDLLLDNVMKVNRQEYKGKLYDKDDVNGFDRKLMHSYSKKRDRAGDCLVALTMATPAVLAFTEKEEWLTCGVMYAETLLIANGIKEMTKLTVTRARPYMYYEPSTFPEDDIDDGDWANSFPSGHSTIAFASATFTSYTFSKYFPDSSLKIPVIAGSYAMACGVAALRISSGNHFMSDVLAGAAIGTTVGFLVPWLHTFNAKHDLNVTLLSNGFSFAKKF
jgi:undecaprenyl-diphosphatase